MNNNDLYAGRKLVTREKIVGTYAEIEGKPYIDGVEVVPCTVRKGRETPIKTEKPAEEKEPSVKKVTKSK